MSKEKTRATLPLPENGVVASVATVVDGKVKGETIHIEYCDSFPEVDYKRDQLVGALAVKGAELTESAKRDASTGSSPPWEK